MEMPINSTVNSGNVAKYQPSGKISKKSIDEHGRYSIKHRPYDISADNWYSNPSEAGSVLRFSPLAQQTYIDYHELQFLESNTNEVLTWQQKNTYLQALDYFKIIPERKNLYPITHPGYWQFRTNKKAFMSQVKNLDFREYQFNVLKKLRRI